MGILNPQVVFEPAPLGFEAVVNSYQQAFSALMWNEKSFGRAYEQPDDEAERRTPKVYTQGGEYIDALPNDNLNAFSFIMARSEERYIDGENLERDVSAVFWLDLSRVRPGVDKASVTQFSTEVIKVIQQHPYTMNVQRVYDERIEDIFFGYITNEMMKSNKYLMYPFGGFRIDFTVGYPNPCDNVNVPMLLTSGEQAINYFTLKAGNKVARVYLVEDNGQLTLEIVQQ